MHQRYGQASDPDSYTLPLSKDKPIPPPSESTPKEGSKPETSQDSHPKSSSAQSQDSTSANTKQSSPSDDVASAASASESPTNIGAELSSQKARDEPSSKAAPAAESEEALQKQLIDLSADHLGSIFQVPEGEAKSSDSKYSSSSSSSSDSSSSGSEHPKPPHISSPSYIHHFDTYGLVKDLGKGGFTDQQSIQMMKAIRDLLADNLIVAKKGLYSISDFENENYLFRAACSELRNSLQTSRNADIQAQRSRRAQLQHESDILSQRLNQELTGLNDNLKEMFNEQKIWTRELQRAVDTNIQELNYKITVSLHSDGRSTVEGLRWILTRRAVMAIATSACEFSYARACCCDGDTYKLTPVI